MLMCIASLSIFLVKTRHMSHPWHLYHADTRSSASSLPSNMPLSSFPNPQTGLSGSAMGYLLHWKNAEQWGHVIWNLCIHLCIANRPSQRYNQIRSEALWKPKKIIRLESIMEQLWSTRPPIILSKNQLPQFFLGLNSWRPTPSRAIWRTRIYQLVWNKSKVSFPSFLSTMQHLGSNIMRRW